MNLRLTKTAPCRRLTLRGWLVVAAGVAAIVFVWSITIHDFLAVNKPLDTNIRVIEGYVPDFVLRDIAEAARKNPDMLTVCAGLPFDKVTCCDELDNYADYNAAMLRRFGADSLRVISAPAPRTDKERTYTAAVAARDKLREKGIASGSINVVCYGAHARRSRYLYRKAFKRDWRVGAVSFRNDAYPPGAWWKNSEGARDVVYEMFAWMYCILFFRS